MRQAYLVPQMLIIICAASFVRIGAGAEPIAVESCVGEVKSTNFRIFAPDNVGATYETTFCESLTESCPDPTPPGYAGVSLSNEGPFSSAVTASITIGQDGIGETAFYIKALNTEGKNVAETAIEAWTQRLNRGDQYWDLTIKPLDYLSIRPNVAGQLLLPNPDDEFYKGGLRIFPGLRQIPEIVGSLQLRRVFALWECPTQPEGQLVYFRAFDVDDPSSDAGPVDDNGSLGDDNRGIPKAGKLTFPSAPIFGNAAFGEFEVSMFPGDNYRIAAGYDRDYLNQVDVDGTGLVGTDGPLPNAKASMTELLTVWRRLHLEVDKMDQVTSNSSSGAIKNTRYIKRRDETKVPVDTSISVLENGRFELGKTEIGGFNYFVVNNDKRNLYVRGQVPNPAGSSYEVWDDDDYNLDDENVDGDVGESLDAEPVGFYSLIQDTPDRLNNVFAAAYIQPTIDGGGDPTGNTIIPFKLNFDVCPRKCPCSNGVVATESQLNQYRDSAANERDDFWVAYLQIAYQGDKGCDFDPISEGALAGLTPAVVSNTQVEEGGIGSLVYLETAQDWDRSVIFTGNTPDFKFRVVPHELGHQFGLEGHKSQYGIMGDSPPLQFVPEHIDFLRSRVKSPGQP